MFRPEKNVLPQLQKKVPTPSELENEERTSINSSYQQNDNRNSQFWSNAPSMSEPSTFARQPYTADFSNMDKGPTETEMTWAKILCWTGGGCVSASSSMLALICYIAAQQMKDMGETHIVGVTEAIGGTGCVCGACLLCIGCALAFKTKRP